MFRVFGGERIRSMMSMFQIEDLPLESKMLVCPRPWSIAGGGLRTCCQKLGCAALCPAGTPGPSGACGSMQRATVLHGDSASPATATLTQVCLLQTNSLNDAQKKVEGFLFGAP